MGTTCVLLLLGAAATLFTGCQSCTAGREFLTAFLPNYYWGKLPGQKLQLALTAQGSAATVSIQVASQNFAKTFRLSPNQNEWVELPVKAQLYNSGKLPNSAVWISSSEDITVMAFNSGDRTGDGTVVQPVRQHATDYVVFTPPVGGLDKVLAVVNGDARNRITFTPPPNVHYLKLKDKSVWRRGQKVTVDLKPYETFLVRSGKSPLTGTRVQSQKPVAVVAGHTCAVMVYTCEHVFEQLPPVAELGKEYMLPSMGKTHDQRVYLVAAEDGNTVVEVHGKHISRIQLSGLGQQRKVQIRRRSHPVVIKSNKKLLAMFLSSNHPFDPFLTTLIPSSALSDVWAISTEGRMPSHAVLLSEREGSGGVHVCVQAEGKKKKKCSRPAWKVFPTDAKHVWSEVALGKQRSHVTVEGGDAPMAVYVYGGKSQHGYGTAGMCYDAIGPNPPPTPPVDPCDGMTCGEKEKCVKGTCVHTSTATCHALGDPHYQTFDGRRYDFQGTCTYVMSTFTKNITNLEHFTVTTKNNHRGNRHVSFVRTVVVHVYDQAVTIGRHRGRVLVNGELVHLPLSLSGGKVSVKRSGSYAVLSTDFGLRVLYDWNSRLYITVPSSYYRHLGGLCGNYNGDRRDDLPQPHGSHMSVVLQMIQSWKVKDSDRFCSDNCGGSCPHCSPKQQLHYQKPSLCGVLTQKQGPFSACHDTVDPAMYLDNCVYDVCINKGARQFLCDSLKSYNDACLSAGVKVNPQWRTIAKCPLSCPAGSHYEACGTACPSSCGDVDSEKKPCTKNCVEGCQCDKGLVLSGDQCVPVSSCGCQREGRYYPPGTIFWADKGCSTKCICVHGKVFCEQVSCKKNERCAVKGGVRDCYPESYGLCYGHGDPHYQTFDGRRFDFQGTCTYVLSQLVKGSDPGLVPFQVLVQNENRGRNKAVSYTKSVSITVYNTTISMSSDDPQRVLVNRRPVNLPYLSADGQLSLYRSGYYGVVRTAFGLTLMYDWRWQVKLILPSVYTNAVGGLCGNYNQKGKDDFQKPDGSLAPNPSKFGHSWKVGGGVGCTSDCGGGKCPECKPAVTAVYQKRQYCGIISDPAGPFKKCHSKLDYKAFLHDCVYDMCAYKGHISALCGSLSAFSKACQDAGAAVGTWRTKDFCPPSCGPNSHYETCAAPCPQTCSGLVSPQGCEEEDICTEGCVCDDGFVLSDNTCVPVAECGCQYNGQYYHIGQVFRPTCNSKCECQPNGQMSCFVFDCSPNEKCEIVEGVASCVPKSIGSCSVGGARTVRTFDGLVYSVNGDCTFILSEVKERTGQTLEAFSVFIRQHTGDSVSRSVEVQVYALKISMDVGVIGEVKLDDITTSLPLSLADGKVSVNQNGNNIVLETAFGLTVTYDTLGGVVVNLPSTYKHAPQGLCGDYNDLSFDDRFQDHPNPSQAWAVDRPCPIPVEPTVGPATKDVCDIIRAPGGPFAGCHATVPSGFYYERCDADVRTGKGGRDILCRHIQAYVSACQSAGATVSSWRTDKFCPLTCPVNSHYELCADTCSSSCSYLLRPGRCPRCHEGCECDEGLAFDGGRCVPVEKCGCLVDGLYYKSGVSVLRDDCSESCECQSGRFSCKQHDCQNGEECGVKDGTLQCYTPDPCAELQCRQKERCEVQEGEAVCVPLSKAVCWAQGDPHYYTFDGSKFSFQGTCSYLLVNTTGVDPTLPEVTVTTRNVHLSGNRYAYLQSASVDILGHVIGINRGQPGFVYVDGVKTHVPVLMDDLSVVIASGDARGPRTRSRLRGVLQTADLGVEVLFDWDTLLLVSLSSSYHGNVAGLCGNYNGNAADDAPPPGANVRKWAETWLLNCA